jgi:hypothetical protein
MTDTSPIRACAEILSGAIVWDGTPAICNVARCGTAYCNDTTIEEGIYAGMIPVKLIRPITAALVEDYGGPADPRQRFDTAFDNPSMTLHLIGDDLVRLDTIAELIIRKYDRTSHIDTEWGTVNGLRIGPPKREVRNDRPRYDLQLTIEMEMART